MVAAPPGAAVAPSGRTSAFASCTLALAKAIIGAGMVAIPRAYLTLGAALGTAMLALVALLVLHSKALLVDGARRYRGATTYRRLVQSAVGPRTGLLAQVSVILFCFGFVVVNLVVLTDVVRGNPPAACNGLVCLLTGAVNGPLESRSLVLLAVAGGAAAPLLLLRSIQRLTWLNYAGIASSFSLAALAAALGASALARGTAQPLPWMPPHLAPDGPTDGGGDNRTPWPSSGGGIGSRGVRGGDAAARHPLVSLVVDAVGVLAVVLTSFVAHQAVHPAMPLLGASYTPARMRRVCAAALAIALAVYLCFAVGACLAFGPHLHANALSSFSVAAMAPLLGGEGAARGVAVALLGGYFVTVLSSLVLFVHPLRTSLAELVWDNSGAEGSGLGAGRGTSREARCHSDGGGGGNSSDSESDNSSEDGSGVRDVAAERESRHYLALTYGILVCATAAAIAIPDIWAALSVIGNGAASVEAFLVPGLLGLALNRRTAKRRAARAERTAGFAATLSQPLLADGVEEGRTLPMQPVTPTPAAAAAAVASTPAGAVLTPVGGHGSTSFNGGGSSNGTGPSLGALGRALRPGPGCSQGALRIRQRLGNVWRASLAWLLLALGCGLLLNGAVQQLLALGLIG